MIRAKQLPLPPEAVQQCLHSGSCGRYLTVIGTADGNLHAIDEQMNKMWTTSSGPATVSATNSNEKGTGIIPTLDGSLLFSGPQGLRKSSLTASMLTDSTPFVTHDGLLFSGKKRSKLIGLDVTDGTLLHDVGVAGDLHGKLPEVAKRRAVRSPLWMGRVDYSLRAVDSRSGQEEFRMSFSELRPLMPGAVIPEAGVEGKAVVPAGREAVQQGEDGAPAWTSLLSTPSGELYFLDSSGHSLQKEGLRLQSPAVAAFLLDISEDSPSLRAALPVHYALSDLHRRNRMQFDLLKGQEQHKAMLLVTSVGNSSSDGNDSNLSSGSSATFAMEAVVRSEDRGDGEAVPILQDLPAPAPPKSPAGDQGAASGAASASASAATDAVGHASSSGSSNRHLATPGLGKRRVTATPRLSAHLHPLGGAGLQHLPSAALDVQQQQQPEEPDAPSLLVPDAVPRGPGVRGYYRIVQLLDPQAEGAGSDGSEQLWVPMQHLVKASSLGRHPRMLRPEGLSTISSSSGHHMLSAVLVVLFWALLLLACASVAVVLYAASAQPALLDEPSWAILVLSSLLYTAGITLPPAPSAHPVSVSVPPTISAESDGRVGALSVFGTVLGYGSHGTVVYLGALNGRPVAVKRMLAQFIHAADREISLLIRSDGHAGVVRYFLKEAQGDFVYLALQLCEMSLRDFIFNQQPPARGKDRGTGVLQVVEDEVRTSLLQVAQGLAHLHALRIVHRDLKPHNILLALPTEQSLADERRMHSAHPSSVTTGMPSALGSYLLKISDMGLSKQLDKDELSFSAASMTWAQQQKGGCAEGAEQQLDGGAAGTVGWQAPELIALRGGGQGRAALLPAADVEGVAGDLMDSDIAVTVPSSRRTLAVDVFSLGCVVHYVLTGGEHPYGLWYEREANIIAGKPDLSRLSLCPDALDLVGCMLQADPARRPTSSQLCSHPFFWPAAKRLDFLVELSDRLEKESADSPIVLALESGAVGPAGNAGPVRWDRVLDVALLEDLGKYRKYDVTSVRDLLRIIRNKRHHYLDLSADLRARIGELPAGFCAYFDQRFPRLLLHCCRIARRFLQTERGFAAWIHIHDQQQQPTAPVPAPPHILSVVAEAAAGEEDDALSPLPSSAESPLSPLRAAGDEMADVIIWHGSSLHSSIKGNGWWRDAASWASTMDRTVGGSSKKGKASHLLKAAADCKYRTRLCSHWEATSGTACPMRKKGKCIFAHGPAELRTTEKRRDRWGRVPSSVDQQQQPTDMRSSGGEDVLGGARSIEKVRAVEGSIGDYERSSGSTGLLQQPVVKAMAVHAQRPFLPAPQLPYGYYPAPAAYYPYHGYHDDSLDIQQQHLHMQQQHQQQQQQYMWK